MKKEALKHFETAGKYEEEGNIEAALDEYKKAIDKDSSAAEIYINLGGLLIDDNEPEKAIYYLTKALDLEPNNGSARHNLKVAKEALGDTKPITHKTRIDSDKVLYNYAGYLKRWFAWMIDSILIIILSFGVGIFIGFVRSYNGLDPAGTDIENELIGGLLFLLYVLLKDTLFNGQSLGKKFCDLRVISLKTGDTPSMGGLISRNVTLVISWFILIESLIILVSKKGQRLGDQWNKTLVIEDDDPKAVANPKMGKANWNYISTLIVGIALFLALFTITTTFFNSNTSFNSPTNTNQDTISYHVSAAIISTTTTIVHPLDIQYVEPIEFKNQQIREETVKIVDVCPSGDLECRILVLFNNFTMTYKHFDDSRSEEVIQTPKETMRMKGGDCEDLTILLQSMLENIGIKTYTVLTEDHAYALACGIDPQTMAENSLQTFYTETEVYPNTEIIEITPKSSYAITWKDYFNYDDMINAYIYFESNVPLQVRFFESEGKLDYYLDKGEATYYIDCITSGQNVFEGCTIPGKGYILLENHDFRKAKVELTTGITEDIWGNDPYSMQFKFFDIGGESCVALDPSTGEAGYVGETITDEPITIIDPLQKKNVKPTKEYTYTGSQLLTGSEEPTIKTQTTDQFANGYTRVYIDPINKITISYPTDWTPVDPKELELEDTEGIDYVMAFYPPLYSRYDEFAENVIITTEDVTGYDITLQDYTDLSIQNLGALFDNYKTVSVEDTTLSGYPAKKIVYTAYYEGISAKVLAVYAIKNNKVYTISYTAENDKYNKYLKEVTTMIDSFRIN